MQIESLIRVYVPWDSKRPGRGRIPRFKDAVRRTVDLNRYNDISKHTFWRALFLKTDPNFDTNAPPHTRGGAFFVVIQDQCLG